MLKERPSLRLSLHLYKSIETFHKRPYALTGTQKAEEKKKIRPREIDLSVNYAVPLSQLFQLAGERGARLRFPNGFSWPSRDVHTRFPHRYRVRNRTRRKPLAKNGTLLVVVMFEPAPTWLNSWERLQVEKRRKKEDNSTHVNRSRGKKWITEGRWNASSWKMNSCEESSRVQSIFLFSF